MEECTINVGYFPGSRVLEGPPFNFTICAWHLRRGVDTLLEELRAAEKPPKLHGGEQRAYVIALTLERFDIALVGAPDMSLLSKLGIEQFETWEEAKEELELTGNGRTVENLFHNIPVWHPD